MAFKQRLYPSAWAKYELATPGSLKLSPSVERHKELERDFKAMQTMIFAKKITFGEMLDDLHRLKQNINALGRQP